MTREDLTNLLGLGWDEVQTCNCDGYFYAYCEYTEKYHVFNSEGQLGVHMIGTYASEIIYGAAMMVEKQMRVEDVRNFVFPHPTVCEVIREGMFGM